MNHNFSGGEKGIFLSFMFIILQLYDFIFKFTLFLNQLLTQFRQIICLTFIRFIFGIK